MDFDKISPKSMEYLAKIAESPDQFDDLTLQFIATRETDHLKVPEFEEKYDWLNTSQKLSFETNLKNKLVVLDFFTYCCINCMHILPQLHELEAKHSTEDGLVVIGVHSAKFSNEKVLSNITSAVLRYDISHPVVNDSDAELWNKMAVRCWPTFVIVSPEGCPLLYLVGETHKDTLFRFVELALKYYGDKGLISGHSLPIQLAKDSLQTGILRFPGKISINVDGTQIAVSDSGNHRVLIFDENGIITAKIGTCKPGLKNGTFLEAQFNSPQGLTWCDGVLYVADTENHLIRKIDMASQMVSTITGSGNQGIDKEGGKNGIDQEISSPWDVKVAGAPGLDQDMKEVKNCLYIAVAGTHQIWCYFLQDGSWLKKSSQQRGTCLRFAGSGNEENRNNSYPHKASFAQPSHLSLGKLKDQNVLFIADSESSSVRTVDLKTGAVKGCVGGERDPMNLFSFGDQDGKSVDAKLQHPLAVAYDREDLLVYVADSYNHKIKWIDPSKNTCTTLTTCGGAGYEDGDLSVCQFNEPGGIDIHPIKRLLYIADTNNHQIRIINLETKNCSSLPLIEPDEMDSPTPPQYKAIVTSKHSPSQREKTVRDVNKNQIVHIVLNFPQELHFTDGVESKWQVSISDKEYDVISFESGNIDKLKKSFEAQILTHGANKDLLLKVELLLYVCIGELCMLKSFVINQEITHDINGGNDTIQIQQNIES